MATYGGFVMDIVEYTEKVYGVRLMEYQKRLIRKMAELKAEDVRVVYGRRGSAAVVVPKPEDKNGLKCRVMFVDDISKEEK